jgi:hypothetical protein
MASTRGTDQSPLVTQRYLNTSSYVGDPSPGTVVSTTSVSGSIVQPYSGQLGGILTLGETGANYYSDLTNGQQLYAGDYQYVQFYASSSASAAVQGQLVYWLDNTTNLLSGNWIVTPDYSASTNGLIAGVALCNTAKGNYWFIQTSGIAQVKFAATAAGGTAAIGDLVFADYSGSSVYAYDPTQTLGGSTSLTLAQMKGVLGIAWATAPSNSTISPVMLGGLTNPKYYPGA